jgi:glyoxylase-like metal-dependent hydrolase (beta-lactamase superfamily II)
MYEQVRAALGTSGATEGGPVPQLTPIAPGIRVLALRTPTLPPAAHTNVYVVGPAGGPVAVVDPGSPYPDQQAALDAALAAEQPALVVLTHHHGDHVGGAQAAADRWGVRVAAHPATAERLLGIVDVEQYVHDGERVHGMTAVHTPGHAVGHLCFELDGATIAGDMVAGVGTILIDPDEGDMGEYLASLERLLARPPAMLLPAHGPAIVDGPAKLREYLAHRRMREARVIAALKPHSASLDELVATTYADTPPALWPLARRSLLAHLAKLAREGRAHEQHGNWTS